MRKRCLLLVVIANLTVLPWTIAQTAKPQLFDLKRSRHELQIMKGILQSTLGFASSELRGGASTAHYDEFRLAGFSGIGAYYLYGQGAVFTISASGLGLGKHATTEIYTALTASHAGGVEGGIAGGVVGGVIGGVAGGVPAVAPQPPQPPQAPQPAAAAKEKAQQENVRERLAHIQERSRKRVEESAKSQAEFEQRLADLKVYLIEALANHGDSLTQVKPNEYVTVIVSRDDPWGQSERARDILSVQKSFITDYKAGRLTLDNFKQRVLDYKN